MVKAVLTLKLQQFQQRQLHKRLNKNSMEQVPWRLIQTAPMSGALNPCVRTTSQPISQTFHP